MDHLKFLFDIGQLDWVFKGSSTIENLLSRLVDMVAEYMRSDVCSIYIYDEAKGELVLRANTGLRPPAVGKIRLKPGEGIAGRVFKNNEPVLAADGFAHPDFRYFKGSGEGQFRAFLAAPIVGVAEPVGVIMLQRKENNPFEAQDIQTLRIVASQLASVLENVKIIMSLQHATRGEMPKAPKERLASVFLKGKASAGGYAFAKATLALGAERFNEIAARSFGGKYGSAELSSALEKTENELESLQKVVETKLSDAAAMIFTAHLLILKDRSFVGTMTQAVEKGKNAPEAVIAAGRKYITLFSASADPYMREKAHDIEDLVTRIIRNLAGVEAGLPPVRDRIAVAGTLYPSELLKLSSEGVRGIVLLSGGVTSHVSILARSLDIPMVIVSDPVASRIVDGDQLLIDGELGNLYINPGKDIVAQFHDRIEGETGPKAPPAMAPVTKTRDGVRVTLLANVNLLKDLDQIRVLSCDGIGLYRSEFPFIIRKSFPTEEEQYFVYRKLVEGAPNKDITFRTLDIGGDKMPAYWESASKENPFLGLRSIRFSLRHPDIFVQQIRAILRAGVDCRLKIMFPMIFSLEEFSQARSVVLECQTALKAEGIAHHESPEIGMMVEIPAAVEIIGEFVKVADFFSIGTNDLTQYMLAVDRTNEEVADYYIPHHPAVLRAIKRVADAGCAAAKDVSVCGDMANHPGYLKYLIGCGIRTLSVNPAYLAPVQNILGAIDTAEAEALVARLVETGDLAEIAEALLGRERDPAHSRSAPGKTL